MASSAQVKKIIQAIHSDPELLDSLLNSGNDDGRKKHLEAKGLIKKGAHGPTRQEVERELRTLTNVPTRAGEVEAERAVEWVAAIGTAAAGAGAAFCAAE